MGFPAGYKLPSMGVGSPLCAATLPPCSWDSSGDGAVCPLRDGRQRLPGVMSVCPRTYWNAELCGCESPMCVSWPADCFSECQLELLLPPFLVLAGKGAKIMRLDCPGMAVGADDVTDRACSGFDVPRLPRIRYPR